MKHNKHSEKKKVSEKVNPNNELINWCNDWIAHLNKKTDQFHKDKLPIFLKLKETLEK